MEIILIGVGFLVILFVFIAKLSQTCKQDLDVVQADLDEIREQVLAWMYQYWEKNYSNL